MLKKFATEAAKRRYAPRRRLLRRSIRVVAVENSRSNRNGDSEESKRNTASKAIQGIASARYCHVTCSKGILYCFRFTKKDEIEKKHKKTKSTY